MKNFKELSEREILALAISLEEEDERVYADFFEGLRQDFGASAAVFDSMRKEESEQATRGGEENQAGYAGQSRLQRTFQVR
jgi:erythrin-vacuolar iron transport family protein